MINSNTKTTLTKYSSLTTNFKQFSLANKHILPHLSESTFLAKALAGLLSNIFTDLNHNFSQETAPQAVFASVIKMI